MNEPRELLIIEKALSSLSVSGADAEAAAEWLAALRRRGWSVRVLDAHGRSRGHSPAYPYPEHDSYEPGTGKGTGRFLIAYANGKYADEDAARHAAALAVFPTLDAATRAKLGECP